MINCGPVFPAKSLLRYCLGFGSAEKCSADLYVLLVYNVAPSPVNHQTYNPSQSNTTPFLRVPIPSTTTSICVPGTRYLGGERPAPTPKNPNQLNQFHPNHTKPKKIKLTTWCPRHNNTPLLQRRPLRKIRHQIRTIKQKIRNILLLSNLPVNNRLQQQLTRIGDLARSNKTRSQRRKCIKSLRESPLRDTARKSRLAL